MRINIPVTPELEAYIDRTGYREHEAQRACREEAATRGELAVMQVAPEQAALLQVLLAAIGARRVLELGTFTGYSALAMALALPPDGKVITCDIDPDIVRVATQFWQRAGVASKIDARVGPAQTALEAMLPDESGSFDLILIDADKPSYPAYFKLAAQLVRPGGLIVVDDTLVHGRVVTGALPNDPGFVAPAVEGVLALNDKLASDDRFQFALLPTRDGLTIAVRK